MKKKSSNYSKKIETELRNKTILVTGGTGAIGSNLIKKLITVDNFDKLVVLDNNSSGHADNLEENKKIVFQMNNMKSLPVLTNILF